MLRRTDSQLASPPRWLRSSSEPGLAVTAQKVLPPINGIACISLWGLRGRAGWDRAA